MGGYLWNSQMKLSFSKKYILTKNVEWVSKKVYVKLFIKQRRRERHREK
jgi:hypothetical protein